MESTPDVFIFFGRFHALMVHLPIGLVCLALLVEFFFRNANMTALRPVISFIWLVAALSATGSVVLGYFLSMQGGYDEGTLNWHKWSGILLALIIHVCYLFKRSGSKKRWMGYAIPVSLGLCTLLLMLTGHYGGSLTHGSGYLSEYQPRSLAAWFGVSSENSEAVRKISSLDSADVFTDAVMPIIKAKCVSCHNTDKKKGNLMLVSYEDMLKGGEDGPALVPGNLEKSGLYYRVTLPADDKKFMPTDGKKPLTNEQLAILRWWIENQAPKSGLISTLQPDSAMRKTLTSYLGINEKEGGLVLEVPPANPASLQSLAKAGFLVSTLAETSNLLHASIIGNGKNKIEANLLPEVKEQLVWLKISNVTQPDALLPAIGQLKNLRKLTLTYSDIGSGEIDPLLQLSHLEYLNLYATNLPIEAVKKLLTLKNLRQVFLDGTALEDSALEQLIQQHPAIKIVYRQPDNEAVDTIPKL